MSVKILIRRSVPEGGVPELTTLLKRLRSVTLTQPGYISGQTLKRIDQPNECIVISTWTSVEDWNTWSVNPQRIAIQNEIDQLLGQETEYAIYE
jgi:heme-degrading monooxygenase HmoA